MCARDRSGNGDLQPASMPTSRASWVAAIVRALEHRGLDGRRIAIDAGIPAAALDRPGARIPMAGTASLWRAAAAATGDDAFGLTVPPRLDRSAFGPFRDTLFASETPHAALRRIARLASFLSDGVLISTHDAGAAVRVAFDPVPEGRTEPEAIDAGFATLLGMLRLLVVPALLDPLELSLRRDRPRAMERFATVFRAPITFGAARDVMTFRRSDLLRPTTAADAAHARRAERVASGEIVLWSTRVRDRIADQLIDGPPSERVIARQLAVSPRALQVHLAREGTTYRAVLEGTREALARAYLGERRMPVKWIASLLGFAHVSGFSRAFKQWTGLGPRAFVLAAHDARPRRTASPKHSAPVRS